MEQKWIKLGLDLGFSDVEIYLTNNKELSIEVYQGKVESLTTSNVKKAIIKGIYDEKLVRASTENLSDDNVLKIFMNLKENAKALTVKEPAIIFEGSKEYPKIKENDFDFNQVTMDDKINYLIALEKNILKEEKVKQVESTYYGENYGETKIINSKGLNLFKKHNFAYSYAYAIFEDKGEVNVGFDIKLIKEFNELDPNKEALNTINDGLSKLGGISLKTGKYETVFSSKTFTEMLSVFQNLFSGEEAYRNLTYFKDKKGEKIASSNVTLWDDPLNELAPFQHSFDDEGVASFPKKIIDKGVFTGFLHDLKTASLFKETPTGNSFSGRISPATLYLEPGNKSFDDLLKEIKNGFYVKDLVGLHAGVNTSSGDFSLQASGNYIKDGKLDHAVKMVVLSGNWFKLLNNIKDTANDLKFEISGVGSPTINVGDLTISSDAK
ncbi:MAG: metallopeptidase TldD-related protein [Acholeplasmataceae bacterium]